MKKPESGGVGATEGPQRESGAMLLVEVRKHSPLKPETIRNCRYKNNPFLAHYTAPQAVHTTSAYCFLKTVSKTNTEVNHTCLHNHTCL